MRRLLLILVVTGVALFGLIQLVPYGHNRTNPPVRSEPAWASTEARATFYRACGDCHSNETKWPLYSRIAPVSWLVVWDVEEGREAFNVSEFDPNDNEGDEAAENVREGEMPLKPYLMMHPEARLAGAEKEAFIRGLIATFGED